MVGLRAYDDEFISYMKEHNLVTMDKLKERFGEDCEFLLKVHVEGGYVRINEDNTVSYVNDVYQIGN